jgi:UDP-N-acetylmuramate--alanine ligase
MYMIGIGGCGMSGLARLLRARGARVTGSDSGESLFTAGLAADGFQVAFDQAREWLPGTGGGGCDLVIASAAIKPDHPQMLEAARRGVPVLTYAEALGRCMIGRTGIAVAGTHGKSTTTAMLGCAMAAAGLDPSVIIGATCPQLGGGFRLGADTVPTGPLAGSPGILAAEACEFNRSFHNFRPRVAAITSVEADHLDIYGSLDAVVEAFRDFARLVPPADEGGTLLIAHEGAHRREVAAGAGCRVETIGFSPSADWSVRYDPPTRQTGLVRAGEGLVAAWVTNLPGEHMAMNAATAAALAITVGADPDKVARSLGEFRGLKRRIEFLGERQLPGARVGGAVGGVRVYDDYGHHPTEIDATLRALRQFERPEERGGRLVCVFQPHQHSRTRFLLEEFASAFSQADVVIVPHIYFVRDSIAEKQKVSAADLVDRLRQRGVQAMHLYPFEAIVEQLEIVCRPGDLLVAMGAGPVNEVAYGYLKAGAEATDIPQPAALTTAP